MNEHVQMNKDHPSLGDLLDLAVDAAPEAGRDALLAHLRVCEECESTFLTMVADHERARTRSDLDLDEQGRPILKLARPARLSRPGRWAAVIPIAAAAMLAFVLIGSPIQLRDSGLSLPLLPPPIEELRLRDADLGSGSELLAGLHAYTRHDFAEAVVRLSDADLDEGTDLVRRVYLGSALAHVGRYGEARRTLERVGARTLPDPWGSEARWTLAVTYERLKMTARADSLIQDLATDSGPVGDRARDYLARHGGP